MAGSAETAPGPRPRRRVLALASLLGGGTLLIALLISQRSRPPLESSLARPFQLLGTPVQLVDRLASRVIPVNDIDEQSLGDVYRHRYEAQLIPGDPTQAYLDRLMSLQLRSHARRPFPYRAFRIGRIGAPNAMALPGGVILISDEMLDLVGSEAELMAVLAHEMGHVELGHCFDRVRFALLLQRSGAGTLGEIADAAINVLLQQSYSKTAENEADDYSYGLLLSSPYDPAALGRLFTAFNTLRRDPGEQHADPLRDYLISHPPGPIREAEFLQRARSWWTRNRTSRRYRGRSNLQERRPLPILDDPREWTMATSPVQAAR
ncbi:MAG: M48 family metallopeptidase [Cyanobium sp.]